jgi:hypothetical protein
MCVRLFTWDILEGLGRLGGVEVIEGADFEGAGAVGPKLIYSNHLESRIHKDEQKGL